MRRAGLYFGYALAAVLVLAGAIIGGLQTAPAKRYIADFLTGELSEPGLAEVSVGRLEGFFPAHIRLLDVRVADAEGEWLTAERLEFDLSLGDALDGIYRLSNAVAQNTRVSRLPAEQATNTAAADDLSFWPSELVLEDFRFDGLWLGPDVAGRAVDLRADGHVRPDRGAGVEVALNAKALSGTDATAAIVLAHDAAAHTLRLDAQVSESAGGMLAHWLDVPELGAVKLAAAGDGPLADWRGTISGQIEGSAKVAADIRIQETDAPHITISGHTDVRQLVGPELAAVVTDDLAFEGAATLQPDQIVEVDHARIAAETAEIELSGRVDLADLTVDAAVSGAAPDLTRFEAALGSAVAGQLEFKGHVEGPALNPKVQVLATVDHPAFDPLSADHLSADLTIVPVTDESGGQRYGVTGQGRVENLAGLDETTQGLLGRDIDWSLAANSDPSASEIAIESLGLDGEGYVIRAQGSLSEGGRAARGTANITLDDLERVADLLQIPAKGRLEAQTEFAADLDSETGQADVTAKIAQADFGEPTIAALLGSDVDIAARVAGGTGQPVRIDALSIDGKAASISGSGTLEPESEALQAKVLAKLPKLAALSDLAGVPLSGRAKVDGTVSGSLTAPVIAAEIAGDAVGIDELALDRLAGTLHLKNLASEPEGTLLVDGRMGEFDATFSTPFVVRDDNTVKLSRAKLSTENAAVNGDLVVDLNTGLLEGELAGRADDVGAIARLLGEEARGAVTFTANLTRSEALQAAQVSVDGKALALDGVDARVEQAHLDLQAADLFGDPTGAATLRSHGVRFESTTLSDLSLDVGGSLSALTFKTSAKGENGEPFEITSTGNLAIEPENLRLQLTALDGRYAKLPISLKRPVKAAFGERNVLIEPFELGVGTSLASGDLTIADERATGHLNVNALSLETVSLFIPDAEASGTLSVSAELSGPAANPNAKFRVQAAELKWGADPNDEVPDLAADIDGTLGGGHLVMTGKIVGIPDSPIKLDADLPLAFALQPFSVQAPRQIPLSAQLDGTVKIEQIEDLLPLGEDRAAGTLEVAVAAAGTLDNPQIAGHASLRDGRYENIDSGAVLSDINAEVDSFGSVVVIESLSAKDGSGGTIEGGGRIDLALDGDFPLSLSATLKNARLLQRDEITATASGDIAVNGDLKNMSVTGFLTIPQADVNIPEELPSDVVELDVVEINTDGSPGPKTPIMKPSRQPEKAPPVALALDVTVDMPGKIFVRGRGLESEWKGQLKIAGTADDPKIVGSLSLVRGQFAFADKTFRLKTGQITFNGDVPPDPDLAVTAEAKAAGILATVSVAGRASAPELTLASDPPLPRDEVLSYLLFGKSASEISAFQAAQLANAAATLSGGGLDPIGKIRQILGVDQLTVSTEGEGVEGAAVAVGKYISDDVYVSVKQGVESQSGKATVEVELTDSITVETGVGADAQSDVWVNWQWYH